MQPCDATVRRLTYEAFIEGIDPKWSGAVPLTLIYDAAGKKVWQLEGEATRKSIEGALPPVKAARPR